MKKTFIFRWLFQWSFFNVQIDGSKGWIEITWESSKKIFPFPPKKTIQVKGGGLWDSLPSRRSGKWRFSSFGIPYTNFMSSWWWLLPGWGAFQGGLMFIQADSCSRNDSNSLGVILLPNNARCWPIYPLIKDNPENGTSVGSQDARNFRVPRNALHVPQFLPQKRYPSLPELSATLHGWPNAAAPAVQLGYGHSVANNERNQSLLNSIVVVRCMHDVCLANYFKIF